MYKNKKYYRPDIDGLRALAILPVVFYHAGFDLFSGGYVGVDIFFVISGYLITSIVLKGIREKTFSFFDFWERRIRRIFPALFVVLFSSSVFAYIFLLYPRDISDFTESLLAQTFFLSNIFFMRRDSYFAEAAEISPLIHTWTLSVEEQFYILLPLALVLAFRFFSSKLLVFLSTLAVTSFAISVYLVNVSPSSMFYFPILSDLWVHTSNLTAGFYLLPSRAWELLVGSIIALTGLVIKTKRWAELASVLGFFAILYSISKYDASTSFPGLSAILPVLGSAAIIVANTNVDTKIKQLLSIKPLIFIGLISYSLYLWHWPIFVFAKIIFGEITHTTNFGLIILSATLAYLSYSLIETPFRKRRLAPNKHVMVFGGIGLMLVLGLSVYNLVNKSEINDRIPEFAKPIAEMRSNQSDRYYDCFADKTLQQYKTDGPCIIGDNEEELGLVIWGDSHAGSLVDVIDEVSSANNVKGAVFAYRACLPIFGAISHRASKDCESVNDLALQFIQDNDIENILLISRWNYYVNSGSGFLIEDENTDKSKSVSENIFQRTITELVDDLKQQERNVFILKQVPENSSFTERSYFYSSIRAGFRLPLKKLPIEEHLSYAQSMDDVFAKLNKEHGVTIIDPTSLFCEQDACFFEENGNLLYRDDDHLNVDGVSRLKPVLDIYIRN